MLTLLFSRKSFLRLGRCESLAHISNKKVATTNAEIIAASKRRSLFASIGTFAFVCTCLDIFAPFGTRTFYSDIINAATAGLAFAVSMLIIIRQKLNGSFPRMFGLLGLGLGLWFAAECIWDYYELNAKIDTPFPSIADAFWLAGYVPFAGFAFGMVRTFPTNSNTIKQLLILSAGGSLLILYPLISIYQQSNLADSNGLTKYAINSLYPISDLFLIAPTALVFIRLRTGAFTFTPWEYLVIAIMLSIVGDIGFALFTARGGMDDVLWIWDPFFQVEYLAIACSLIWYRSFFTVDTNKMLKKWQEANR